MIIRLTVLAVLPLLFVLFQAAESAAQGRQYDPQSYSVGPDYIALEVRGVLRVEGTGHVVESADPKFPRFKVRVILLRTEDKNHFLTRHLEKLEGKTVIARGGLDTRRLKEKDWTVYLHLSDISQVMEVKSQVGSAVKPSKS